MKGRAKEGGREGGGGKEERLQPGVAKKKKAYDSPASGRGARACLPGLRREQSKQEEKEKHTHIVLCVVVGDFIILQTSRTETQTFFFLGGFFSHRKSSGNAPVSKLVGCARV